MSIYEQTQYCLYKPGEKDQQCIGKENGKSKIFPIRYLLWTIRDLLEIINGCSGIVQSEIDDFTAIFDRILTFRQLYKFLKKHKEFVFNKGILQASGLCEICRNLIFLAKYQSLSMSMSPKLNLPIQTNIHSLIEAYSCDSSSKACMYSTCDECCDTGLKVEDFKDDCIEIQFINGNGSTKKSKKWDLFCRLVI